MSESILKNVKPYFKYAAEMSMSVPIMAYYCKLYAVQQGMQAVNAAADKEKAKLAKEYLMTELTDLEKMKPMLGGVSKEDAFAVVENFVLSGFAKADKEERTCAVVGREHAVAFNHSKNFIQVLQIWGNLSEEWQKRLDYCKYKAGTILKCLKEGTEPPRGNPFEPEPEQNQEETKADVPNPMMGASMPPQQPMMGASLPPI